MGRRGTGRTPRITQWTSPGACSPGSPAVLPDLLVTEQVKALLRIDDRALYDWGRRGWLTPRKLGRRKFYSAEEVLRLLREGTPKHARKKKK